jgi:hypothetical protein
MKKFQLKIFLIIFFALLSFGSSIIPQSRIAIVYSSYTEKLSENHLKEITNQITFWELFLMQNKIQYEVIYEDDLKDGIEDDFDILILPSVYNISEEESNSIKLFLNDGKSILSAKSRLNLNQPEEYTLYNKSQSIFNFEVEEVEAASTNATQTLNFNYVLKPNPNFDNKILLTLKNSLLAVDFNTDNLFSLGKLNREEIQSYQSSIACGKTGAGKFVWLGFNQDDIIGGDADIKEYKNILLSSLEWLKCNPKASIGYWPSDYLSSTIILIELNKFLEVELIEKLKMDGYKPHLVLNLNQKIPDEIKTKFNNEDYILDLSNQDTQIELKKIISDTLTYLSNQDGIKIENIILAENDLKGLDKDYLKSLGIKTVLINSNINGLPSTLSKNLITIPFNKLNDDNGGIDFIYYSPKVYCDSNPVDEFLLSLANKNSSGTWFTDLGSLFKWWTIRENLQTKLSTEEDEKLSLIITNNNSMEVDDIQLILDFTSIINTGLLTFKEENQLLDYSIDKRTGLIQLDINSVKARQSKKIFISAN